MFTVVLSALALVAGCIALARAFADHRVLARRLRALETLASDAERSVSARSRLAGEIAHEIKNPITAILCSAETLDIVLGDQLPADHRQSLRYIKEYGEHLLKLLTDFLELSRAESGVVRAVPETVSVSDAIEGCCGLLRATALRKQISIVGVGLQADLHACCDPRHVKQILFNVLHNALKFSPLRGTVEIGVRHDGDSDVLIAVTDQGPGVPADVIPSLFDPYVKLEGAQPRHETGVGLGLALCRKLVELNGGSIKLESEPGHGCTVTVRLPKASSEREKLVDPDDDSALCQPLVGQTFLVVDRDPVTRDSVSKLIEALGGAVDQVGAASDAVEALSARSYDAVLVDRTEDNVDPTALSRMIRNESLAHNTTIVLATKEPTDEASARACGADRLLRKPLNKRSLVRSLLNSGKYQVTH